jgi:uncharacterized protein YaaQ
MWRGGAEMKLMTVIVQRADAKGLGAKLRDNGYAFTVIGSTGGFLRQGNTTFLIGIESNEVDATLALIQENCKARTQVVNSSFGLPQFGEPYVYQPIEVKIGGAVVFVLDLEQFGKF